MSNPALAFHPSRLGRPSSFPPHPHHTATRKSGCRRGGGRSQLGCMLTSEPVPEAEMSKVDESCPHLSRKLASTPTRVSLFVKVTNIRMLHWQTPTRGAHHPRGPVPAPRHPRAEAQ